MCCHKSLDTVLNQYKLMLKDVFCILTPYSLVEIYKYFGGTCCLHFQSRKDFESVNITSHSSTLKMEAWQSSKMLINSNMHYGITTQKPAFFTVSIMRSAINVLVQEVHLACYYINNTSHSVYYCPSPLKLCPKYVILFCSITVWKIHALNNVVPCQLQNIHSIKEWYNYYWWVWKYDRK